MLHYMPRPGLDLSDRLTHLGDTLATRYHITPNNAQVALLNDASCNPILMHTIDTN